MVIPCLGLLESPKNRGKKEQREAAILRHSTRHVRPPARFDDAAYTGEAHLTIAGALASPKAQEWKEAMKRELKIQGICTGERGADRRKNHRHQMSGSGEGGEGSLRPEKVQSQAGSERVHTEGWHRLLRNLRSSMSGGILENIDWYQAEESHDSMAVWYWRSVPQPVSYSPSRKNIQLVTKHGDC